MLVVRLLGCAFLCGSAQPGMFGVKCFAESHSQLVSDLCFVFPLALALREVSGIVRVVLLWVCVSLRCCAVGFVHFLFSFFQLLRCCLCGFTQPGWFPRVLAV